MHTQQLGNSRHFRGEDGYYLKGSDNQFKAISLWNERQGSSIRLGKGQAPYERITERGEMVDDGRAKARISPYSYPGLPRDVIGKFSSAKPIRSIADGELETLAGIALLKTYGDEGRLKDYKRLVFRVASCMPDVKGGETFWNGLNGRLKEEGTFAESILLADHPGRRHDTLALFAYDVGKLIGAKTQVAFSGGRVIARVDNFMLKDSTIAQVGYKELEKLAFTAESGDIRRSIYKSAGNRAYDAEEYMLALSCFLEIIEITPDDADAYRLAGNALVLLGRQDDALPYLRKAVEKSSDNEDRSDSCVGLAIVRSRSKELKQVEMAIEDCTEAIEADPKNADAYGIRGDLYWRMAEYGKAEDDYLQYGRLTGREWKSNA